MAAVRGSLKGMRYVARRYDCAATDFERFHRGTQASTSVSEAH